MQSVGDASLALCFIFHLAPITLVHSRGRNRHVISDISFGHNGNVKSGRSTYTYIKRISQGCVSKDLAINCFLYLVSITLVHSRGRNRLVESDKSYMTLDAKCW